MYTLKDAAEAVGMTKSAIFKAIKSGKISGSKDAHGYWYIDPAELHRVYKPVTKKVDEPVIIPEPIVEVEDFSENEFLKQEREQLLQTINDLRRRLDESETERRSTQEKLTLLLEYKPSATVEPRIEKKGENKLWEKIFRK